MIPPIHRLRKHADYQRVYKASRKQFGKQSAYFFLLRQLPLDSGGTSAPNASCEGARIGLTVGKALGKSVDRNRIKRRMRAAVSNQLALLSAPVDVVLHPKRTVMDLDFSALEREVAAAFRAIQQTAERLSARPRVVVE